jgi:hypothetical protein
VRHQTVALVPLALLGLKVSPAYKARSASQERKVSRDNKVFKERKVRQEQQEQQELMARMARMGRAVSLALQELKELQAHPALSVPPVLQEHLEKMESLLLSALLTRNKS